MGVSKLISQSIINPEFEPFLTVYSLLSNKLTSNKLFLCLKIPKQMKEGMNQPQISYFVFQSISQSMDSQNLPSAP